VSDDLSIPAPTYRIPRRGRGLEPGTKRLVVIAGVLGGVLVALVGTWSMIGHRGGTVPVVQADNRPIRVKPDNPGGMQVAGANDDILSGGTGIDGGKLTPPPEAPGPQALRAPPPPPVAAPMAAPVPAPAVQVALPKPANPPARPGSVAVNEKPAIGKPAVAGEKRAAVPIAASAPQAAKGTFVQLAAFSSEAAAKGEWRRLETRMPQLFNRHRPDVSKTERDGRIYWRLRTGGFGDVAQATAFCERVRAKGAGCSVADF